MKLAQAFIEKINGIDPSFYSEQGGVCDCCHKDVDVLMYNGDCEECYKDGKELQREEIEADMEE